jgi:hypothetical protein
LIIVTDIERYLFANTGDKHFELVTNEASLSESAYAMGVAWGDYNKDGFLDMIIANLSAEDMVYKNNGNNNHWISFKLVGTNTNRDAIGAKVKIKSNNKWQMDYIASQSGSYSSNSFNIEFGLGASEAIDTVLIEWPLKGFQIFTNVEVNQFLTITEPASFPVAAEIVSVSYDEAGKKVDVTWNHSATESAFLVERSISDKNHFINAGVTTTGVKTFSEQLTIPESDTVYYRVSAIQGESLSLYSNVKGALVEATKTITGIDKEENSVIFYPNPAGDFIVVNNRTGIIKNVNIINSIGEMVFSGTPKIDEGIIKLANLTNGMYVIRFIMADHVKMSKLFISK